MRLLGLPPSSWESKASASKLQTEFFGGLPYAQTKKSRYVPWCGGCFCESDSGGATPSFTFLASRNQLTGVPCKVSFACLEMACDLWGCPGGDGFFGVTARLFPTSTGIIGPKFGAYADKIGYRTQSGCTNAVGHSHMHARWTVQDAAWTLPVRRRLVEQRSLDSGWGISPAICSGHCSNWSPPQHQSWFQPSAKQRLGSVSGIGISTFQRSWMKTPATELASDRVGMVGIRSLTRTSEDDDWGLQLPKRYAKGISKPFSVSVIGSLLRGSSQDL